MAKDKPDTPNVIYGQWRWSDFSDYERDHEWIFDADIEPEDGDFTYVIDTDVTKIEKERDCYKDKIERFGNTSDPTAFDFNVLHRIDKLEECLAFFRSVIQSGEKWSDQCEAAYIEAMKE